MAREEFIDTHNLQTNFLVVLVSTVRFVQSKCPVGRTHHTSPVTTLRFGAGTRTIKYPTNILALWENVKEKLVEDNRGGGKEKEN